MRRTPGTVEKSADEVYHRFKTIERTNVYEMMRNGEIDPDVDKYHEVMNILSKELIFVYEREKNK